MSACCINVYFVKGLCVRCGSREIGGCDTLSDVQVLVMEGGTITKENL